jgi:hypothetical protein
VWGAAAAALVATAAALAAAAPSPPPPAPPPSSSSSTDLQGVVNWAVNSVSLATAKSGGPVDPPEFGATADNIARRLAKGGNADGSLVHFATHGVVNVRIDVGGASPEVVDAMVGGRGGAADSGALPVDETPGDDSDNPTPGTPSAAAAARLAALGAYAASAVTLPLGPGSSPPQVFIGREPMPPAQLSWRLSDGRASTPDPAAWPAAPAYGGDWPMLRPQRSPAPAAPAEMPAAKVVVLGGERRRRRRMRLLRRLLAVEEDPKGGNNSDNNKAAAAQQQQPKSNKGGPSPDDVPLYVSYYALSPMQAQLVAGYLNRLCPLNTRADGSSADATVGGGRAPPPTLGTACVAALSRAAAVLRPSQEEASRAPNGSAIARAYEWGAQPLAYLREPASVATYLTTAVPMTAQQVDEGAADKTASFFGDGSKLQREVAPPGVDVSPLPPQHFYGSYLPRGLRAASSPPHSSLDPWKIALIVLASLAALAILVGAALLARRAVRARKAGAAAGGGEVEEDQKQQAGANGSSSGRGGGGKGTSGGSSAGGGGGRRKRRASLYGVDKSSGKRGSTSSGGAGPSSSSAAGPSSASAEGRVPGASGPSFGIVGAVFHGLRSSFTGGRGSRYPPHAQRGDSVSSAAHHERRRLDAATAGSLDASAPSGRLPSTVEEPPMPQDGGRGGLSAFSPFSQQQQPKQEEEPPMPQDGGRGGLSAFSPFSQQQQQQQQPKQEEDEPLPQDGGRGGLSAFSPFSQQQQEDVQPFGPPSWGNQQQQQQQGGGGGLRRVE